MKTRVLLTADGGKAGSAHSGLFFSGNRLLSLPFAGTASVLPSNGDHQPAGELARIRTELPCSGLYLETGVWGLVRAHLERTGGASTGVSAACVSADSHAAAPPSSRSCVTGTLPKLSCPLLGFLVGMRKHTEGI